MIKKLKSLYTRCKCMRELLKDAIQKQEWEIDGELSYYKDGYSSIGRPVNVKDVNTIQEIIEKWPFYRLDELKKLEQDLQKEVNSQQFNIED